MSRQRGQTRPSDFRPRPDDGARKYRMPDEVLLGMARALVHWYACDRAVRGASLPDLAVEAGRVDRAAAWLAAVHPPSRPSLPEHFRDTRRHR